MNIAKVVVDVAASPTDNLFDYLIPNHLINTVQPGVRVIVPFGVRKVMGFVVEITNESEFTELKEIVDVMDYHPILTPELIDLSKWLQKEYLCFRITALQVMLPAVFKAEYEKEVWILNEDQLPQEWKLICEGREVVPFSDLEKNQISQYQISKLVSENVIDIKYVVKRKNKVKKDIYVKRNKEIHEMLEELDSITPQAKKQKDIIEFFVNEDQPILLKDLLKKLNTTRGPINSLVKKGILTLVEQEVYRDPYVATNFERTQMLRLTDQQKRVMESILNSLNNNEYKTFLLHGVTGSGKTEIYLQSIEHVINQGKEAIVLVPEISLTPQMVKRFKARFGNLVAVMHSGLSVGEKRKEVKVVVGARSAIFAPFENIGIIIIDEEHETTYKQEDHPKYHAREVAKRRAKNYQCPVILGSATPTLESYARALKGNYQMLKLTERVNQQKMPEVNIVDMRKELIKGNRSMFSDLLTEKIHDRLDKNEQIVLLLNRRGHSTFIMCRECGQTIKCEQCDISMTYHKNHHTLKCHYCNEQRYTPKVCPSCQSEAIRFFGTGTQKVEEALNIQFPEAKVIRMDVDTTSRKGAHERLLKQFENQEANILLGTQMIAKGLDFENVTLVGVLAADAMLNLPDFRAAEKSFQLLTQVSGRAGRHQLPGEVVIQTYTPEHYSVEFARTYDYDAFFNREMRLRKQFSYPPYYYLALINISHTNHVRVIEVANDIVNIMSKFLPDRCILMGPTPSPIMRIKNRFRYQCMVKYKSREDVDLAFQQILKTYQKEINQNKLQLTIDLEPYQFQ